MKKLIVFLLSIIIMVTLLACSAENPLKSPVLFYYPAKTVSYGSSDGVIRPEKRDSADYKNDPSGLIMLYLQGPKSTELVNPFPEGLTVRSYAVLDTEVILELSPHFSTITGMELTMASTSLARTIFHLTSTKKLTIITEGVAQTHVINASDLLFEDIPQDTTSQKE